MLHSHTRSPVQSLQLHKHLSTRYSSLELLSDILAYRSCS